MTLSVLQGHLPAMNLSKSTRTTVQRNLFAMAEFLVWQMSTWHHRT